MFTRASRIARKLFYGPAVVGAPVLEAGDVGDLFALAVVVARLPRLRVELTTSAAGRWIAARLKTRKLGIPKNRIAQAVLPLPRSMDEYLQGRKRHALRTNIRRARSSGITCQQVHGETEVRSALEHLSFEAEYCPDDHSWVAVDGNGEPIGLATVMFDAEWAVLKMLIGRGSQAGWLLHTHVVQTLCEAGVGYLALQPLSALLDAPKLQYFERLLGYRVVNLKRPVIRQAPC